MKSELLKRYNVKNEKELLAILKNYIILLYNKNSKLTVRMINKEENLPNIVSINKILKKYTNIQGDGITQIYNFIEKEIPKKKLIMVKRHKYNYEEISLFFKNQNAELISKNFNSVNDKIKYKCSCGNIAEIKISDFLRGHRCKKCGILKNTNKRKLSYETLQHIYKQYECKLLSPYKDYKNNQSKLKFICKCGKIDEKSFSSFKITGRCKKCGIESISKKNHYYWKGGISPLHEYLRKHIFQWKIKSIIYYSNRCVITNSKNNLIVHHLYKSFSEILKETVDICNLGIRSSIKNYSETELDKLKITCLDLHYKYGLGICLNNYIHKLFHMTYGNKDNTIEQFLEFIDRLSKGEFKTYLKENNLKLNINYKAINEIKNRYNNGSFNK